MTDSERTNIVQAIEHSAEPGTMLEDLNETKLKIDGVLNLKKLRSVLEEPVCAKNAHTELEEALKIMEESAKFLEDFGDVKKYYKPEKCEHNFVTYKGSLSGPKYCFKCKQWEEPTSQFPLKQTDYFPPINERYATSNPYNGIKILEHQLRETNKKLDNMTAYLRERHT